MSKTIEKLLGGREGGRKSNSLFVLRDVDGRYWRSDRSDAGLATLDRKSQDGFGGTSTGSVGDLLLSRG